MYNPIPPKLLKEKIGQPLWVIPLCNAVARGVALKDQIKSGSIEKVGSKIVTLNNNIGRFNLDGSMDSNNYAYLAFLSEQEAYDYIDIENFIQDLKHRTNLKSLPIEKLKEIKKIIES